MNKIVTLITITLAALTFAAAPATAADGPAGIPANPEMFVRVQPGINKPLGVRVMNRRVTRETTPIIISSTTPTVCTVPANSFVGSYGQISKEILVTVKVGHGTCTLRADQAASLWYPALFTQQSFSF